MRYAPTHGSPHWCASSGSDQAGGTGDDSSAEAAVRSANFLQTDPVISLAVLWSSRAPPPAPEPWTSEATVQSSRDSDGPTPVTAALASARIAEPGAAPFTDM